MQYNWQDFEDGQPYGTANRVHVTINQEGKIFFNKLAVAALGSPDGVSLMYDSRQSVIGVKASPLNQRSSYLLRKKQKKYGGLVITAKNFCKRFGIYPTETLAFTAAEVDKDGILILDLNEVKSVGKR